MTDTRDVFNDARDANLRRIAEATKAESDAEQAARNKGNYTYDPETRAFVYTGGAGGPQGGTKPG